MRDRTDADRERRSFAATSTLAALASHLGRDKERWLEKALEPLPETFRISTHRRDRHWTIQQVKALGGVEVPWMPKESAFTMPFPRGKAPEGLAKRMMALLHETGRITRQEVASMLPVRLLNTPSDALTLDMCAAPGSKTTQLAERLHPNGVVVANEPVSGRLNMLVSNKSRLGLLNVVVTQHDGRHFGRLPPPGFDAVVADVPCTGTATTRKNRDVWWDWTPKESRKMFTMQVDIAVRGASLLVPGGHMMYSTCSIDPTENEAVVAEVLRRCPYLELVPMTLDGITLHPGLTSWSMLDETGKRSCSTRLNAWSFSPQATLLQPTESEAATATKTKKKPSKTSWAVAAGCGMKTTTPVVSLSLNSDTLRKTKPPRLMSTITEEQIAGKRDGRPP